MTGGRKEVKKMTERNRYNPEKKKKTEQSKILYERVVTLSPVTAIASEFVREDLYIPDWPFNPDRSHLHTLSNDIVKEPETPEAAALGNKITAFLIDWINNENERETVPAKWWTGKGHFKIKCKDNALRVAGVKLFRANEITQEQYVQIAETYFGNSTEEELRKRKDISIEEWNNDLFKRYEKRVFMRKFPYSVQDHLVHKIGGSGYENAIEIS